MNMTNMMNTKEAGQQIMTNKPKNLMAGLEPVHPGALLREDILPAMGKSKVEIAELIHVSRQALHSILSEKAAVTPEMALRFGKLCGNGAEFWLRLQLQFDLWRASQTVDTSAIPTLEATAA